jgi:AraC-like DNA-binding protein
MTQIPVRQIKATQKEPEFSGSFSIRAIEALLGNGDMVQKLHRHDFYLILALQKGIGKHSIDLTPYSVNDHCVFVMRPGQIHELVLNAGSTGYILQFNAEFYPSGDLLRQISQQNHYQMNDLSFVKSLIALTTIFEEHRDKLQRFQEVIQAHLDIFFTGLVRLQQTGTFSSERRYRQERLDKFMALLEQHVFMQKHVSQYAYMLNLSSYQLNSITKEVVGKTASALINEQIIMEAKRCLLATPYQVNQIAYHMGYEDPSYFIRFFKKQTGQSPEVFRHNFR